MNLAVVTALYGAAAPYLEEFANSLANQTDRDFSLLAIDDADDSAAAALPAVPYPVLIKSARGTPATLRKAAIAFANDLGFDAIIFADSDDWFDRRRIEVVRRLLTGHELVFNRIEVSALGSSADMLAGRFLEGDIVNAEHLRHGNCLGLSNTAGWTRLFMASLPLIPSGVIAFDWALFSATCLTGATATYTTQTCTYYRRHDRNAAPLDMLTSTEIMIGVRVKVEHYRFMASLDRSYALLARRFSSLYERLKIDTSFRCWYCDFIARGRVGASMWWEPIRMIKEIDECA